MKKKDEVANPPAGWEPDRTFVKRSVHFGEPPNETENPFVRVSIEKNVVDLDPGESGMCPSCWKWANGHLGALIGMWVKLGLPKRLSWVSR